MRLDFTKMHGLGNDFIVFDAPRASFPSAEQFRRLADRHTGIGFDQALILAEPDRPGAHVRFRVVNADGGEVEQCGNGMRCIAALLHRRGRAALGETVVLEGIAGRVRAEVRSRQLVSVDMGVPNFAPSALPFDAPAEADVYSLDVAGAPVEIGAVSLGNPHAVTTVSSVDTAPVETLGPLIESHRRFGKRVNVGFMQIVDRSHVRLRVFERGVGETLACGTGACAAVAVARRRGLAEAEVRVGLPGGELQVNWQGAGEPIWLTGPAEVSFEGRVEL
jgi:diaminopimelate epimerase